MESFSVNPTVSAYHSSHTSYRPLGPNPTLSQDIFVGRFSGTGFIPDWFTYYGSASSVTSLQNNDIGYGLAVDNNGNIYVVGQTASSDFEVVNDPNIPQISSSLPTPNTEGVIIKFGCNSNSANSSNSMARIGIEEFDSEMFEVPSLNQPSISFYPNPFEDQLSIVINGISGNGYEVELYDTKGMKIISVSNIEENKPFSLETNLKTGIYIVKVSSDNFVETKRIEKY